MRMRLWLLACCLAVMGCASERQTLREREETPSVFLPAELLEWEPWEEVDEEEWEVTGWRVYFVEGDGAGVVEPVMARRPLRRGGRSGPGGRLQPPLLNPRPTREEIAARRRQAEEHRLVQQARERYFQALAEARARYPNHHGYQEHHFIPIYLGGARNGVTYRLQSAYHQAITQAFRAKWGYNQKGRPSPTQLQQILLEVYSEYPIPQLIGITP
jgi:hypothetical protein